MIRRGIVLSLLSTRAFGDDASNVMAGHDHPASILLGVEGGAGIGPERVNLGFEFATDRGLGYIELDPWFLVGGSLGFGVDTNLEPHPVLGVWEAVPIVPVCKSGTSGYHFAATISVSFRYTGMFELYVAPKFGGSASVCLDG